MVTITWNVVVALDEISTLAPTQNEPMDLILTTLLNSSLAALLLGVLGYILKKWLIEKISNSVKHVYEKKLETFKNEFTREQSVANTTFASYLAAKSTSSEKVQNAVAELWSCFLEIGESEPQVVGLHHLLTKQQIEHLPRDTSPHSVSALANSSLDSLIKGRVYSREVDVLRLYTGESLWSYFFALRTVVGRITYLTTVERARKPNGDIKYFLDDQHTLRLVTSLDPVSFKHIEQMNVGAYTFIKNVITQKFLEEARRIISGEADVTLTIEQAKLVIEASRSLESTTLEK